MIRHALALMLAAASAAAEPFVILIHESPDQIALRADPAAAGQAYRCAWSAGAAAAGVINCGAAMVPVPVAPHGDLSPRRAGSGRVLPDRDGDT